MGTPKTREHKVNWILFAINQAKKAGVEIDFDKLAAEFALACGSTERTGKEIIALLKKTGRV